MRKIMKLKMQKQQVGEEDDEDSQDEEDGQDEEDLIQFPHFKSLL